MHVTKIPADVVFRVFTSCQGDPETLILDVRPLKEFKKSHILNAYSIRVAANGKTLLDYSKNTYNRGWSEGVWWDKHVVIYGEEKLKRDHPVAAFLAADNHAKSVNVFADGLEAFEKQYPFLITQSVKANLQRRYPGEIAPGLLYLGDWDHANEHDRLDEIKIRRIITIHNNPENMKPPAKYKHLQLTLADVETADISQFFNTSYEFIEKARTEKTAVLVHCGAGVSRSATLCIAYLMRKFNWTAEKARAHCVQRRSIVMPNDGFWRSLCAFEGQLGLQQRSDPGAVSGFSGADMPVRLAEGAAGEKVTVAFVSMHKLKALTAARESARKRKREGEESVDKDSDRKRPRSENGAGIGPSGRAEGGTNVRSSGEGSSRRHEDRDRKHEREDDRHRRRDRSRSRDRHRRDRSRSRDGRRTSRIDDQRRQSIREDDRREASHRTAPEFLPEELEEPSIVLETIKDGKAIGHLEISMKNSLQRCTFGRLPSNEVVLEHLSISRQHAQLTLDKDGALYITDLGSAHQTNLDGVWIRPNQPRPLPISSVFKLGGSSRGYKVIMTPQQHKKDEAKRKREADLKEAMGDAQRNE